MCYATSTSTNTLKRILAPAWNNMQPAALPSGICQAGGRAKLSGLAVSYDVYPGVDLREDGTAPSSGPMSVFDPQIRLMRSVSNFARVPINTPQLANECEVSRSAHGSEIPRAMQKNYGRKGESRAETKDLSPLPLPRTNEVIHIPKLRRILKHYTTLQIHHLHSIFRLSTALYGVHGRHYGPLVCDPGPVLCHRPYFCPLQLATRESLHNNMASAPHGLTCIQRYRNPVPAEPGIMTRSRGFIATTVRPIKRQH